MTSGCAVIDIDDVDDDNPSSLHEQPVVTRSVSAAAAPIGRGRGITLPAWITRQRQPMVERRTREGDASDGGTEVAKVGGCCTGCSAGV